MPSPSLESSAADSDSLIATTLEVQRSPNELHRNAEFFAQCQLYGGICHYSDHIFLASLCGFRTKHIANIEHVAKTRNISLRILADMVRKVDSTAFLITIILIAMSKTIDFEKKVIENIFKIAYEKGYKEQVIADALNLDRTVSSKIKSGAKVLRISMLPDIARALEVDVVDLFTYPEKYTKEIGTDTLEEQVSVTFHVPASKRKELLQMVLTNVEIKKGGNPVETCNLNE